MRETLAKLLTGAALLALAVLMSYLSTGVLVAG